MMTKYSRNMLRTQQEYGFIVGVVLQSLCLLELWKQIFRISFLAGKSCQQTRLPVGKRQVGRIKVFDNIKVELNGLDCVDMITVCWKLDRY